MNILITGGLGYIGSHTCVELLNNNYNLVIIDNLSNSNIDVLSNITKITNKNPKFYKGDILDEKLLNIIFAENDIDLVIHFAGLKAVAESTIIPLDYYWNNVTGTLCLLKTMKANNVKNIIFSSSATVYGLQEKQPINENADLKEPTNPYGRSKYFIEYILKDLYKSDNSWNIVLLRYFNPIGAHKSGLIGEAPNGVPNNLMPYVTQVAAKKREYLNVFGNDYDTKDGTGVRDYIHVCDLARGHRFAMKNIINNKGLSVYNLGTGRGYSVLELVNAFMNVNGIDVPYKIVNRRPGDIGTCYADPSKAYNDLGFKCEYNLEDMCRDSWNWEKKRGK